jgi:glyoxylase-like metal-dependent hydrolase (beta-lactamase superfamily II)
MDETYTNQIEWLANQGWDPRIHIAANGDLVNVFILVTKRYVILVDTLINPITAGALVEHAQPFLAGRQLLVINSHADWDHAWGTQFFVGANAPYPAPIIAHEKTISHSTSLENIAFLQRMQAEQPSIFGDVIITKPTITFPGELWIDGGDLTLHLFPTPGHTPDHVSIFIPEISTLLAGDAAEIPFPILHSAEDLPALRASLAAMAALHPREAFYCHAPATTGPQLLLDNIAYYNALEKACRAALADGFDTSHLQNTDLPGALECPFETVAPTSGPWASVTTYGRTERHGQQLRFMLTWLESAEQGA